MAIIPSGEKVFMVNTNTNTTFSGSAATKAMQEWYTMQDVTNTIKPYKVFTALLTQTGGDGPGSLLSQDEPSLTIGTTYQIVDDGGSGWDFTNVGAPNNDLGTYFIATGTTPASWGENAILSFNTGVPVVTILENTIGNIWFTYVGPGDYQIPFESFAIVGVTLSNSYSFISNNTFSQKIVSTLFDDGDGPLIQIYTANDSNNLIDGILQNTPIEIRIYN